MPREREDWRRSVGTNLAKIQDHEKKLDDLAMRYSDASPDKVFQVVNDTMLLLRLVMPHFSKMAEAEQKLLAKETLIARRKEKLRDRLQGAKSRIEEKTGSADPTDKPVAEQEENLETALQSSSPSASSRKLLATPKEPTVGNKEFHDFWNDCALGNTKKVKSTLLRAKSTKELKYLLTSVNQANKVNALCIAAVLGQYGAVKEILAAAKDNPKLLREILIQTGGIGVFPLYGAANQGRDGVVKEILAAAKDNPKLLREILIQTGSIGASPLYVAANQGRDGVVKEILAAAKDNPKLLREILIQKSKGESPLYTAVNLGKDEVVKEILAAAKDNPKLLREILIQTDSIGVFPLYGAANQGRDGVVKEILAAAKDNPKLLREILIQKSKGESPLYTAVNLGKDGAVKEILTAAKDNPKLLREILIQTNNIGASPLYAAADKGRDVVVIEILAAVKDDPDFLQRISDHKPAKDSLANLSILNHLLMAGNEEAIKMILESNQDITTEKLPSIYFSNTPKTAVCYLEALVAKAEKSSHPAPTMAGNAINYLKTFITSSEKPSLKLTPSGFNKIRVSYFQLEEDQLKEVSVNNMRLSTDDPVMVSLSDSDREVRRVIIGSDLKGDDLKGDDFKRSANSLKKAIGLANTARPKVCDVVVNSDFLSDDFPHAITLKFSRDSDSRWKVAIYDVNTALANVTEQDLSKCFFKYNKFLTNLSAESGIEIEVLPEWSKNAIFPNYVSKDIEGSCDMSSSITSAFVALGEQYTSFLREECKKIGKNCVERIGEELNPEIDKILARKLEVIKEKSRASDKSAPSPSPAPSPTSESLKGKHDGREL